MGDFVCESPIVPCYSPLRVSFERGVGSILYDSRDKEYIDFCSGIATCSLGHSHPSIVEAICKQAKKLVHVSNLYTIPESVELASLYTQLSFADKVFFCNSGTEAVEAGIKMVRAYQRGVGYNKKFRIVTFDDSFHGRTFASSSACGKLTDNLGPGLEGFDKVPVDLDAVKKAISDETAGVLIEPVQGEGGVNVIPFSFLEELRRVCDDHGLLLFFDCVQCGSGRTGRLFAYQHTAIEPDVCTIAKGMGGGFPVGACLARKSIAEFLKPGMHGSTCGGNPLAASVSMAVLKEITSEGFLESVARKGIYMKNKLQNYCNRGISSVVGMGLMLGLRVDPDFKNKVGGIINIVAQLAHRGLLCARAGTGTIRLLPPLTISENEIDRGCQIIADYLNSV